MIIYKDNELETHRFTCRCLSHQDPLEIEVDLYNNEVVDISVCLYPNNRCDYSLWKRITRAVRYIFNWQPEPWNDMHIRQEDIPEIISILERFKKK
jgi:hypothetical protein